MLSKDFHDSLSINSDFPILDLNFGDLGLELGLGIGNDFGLGLWTLGFLLWTWGYFLLFKDFHDSLSPNSDFPILDLTLGDLGLELGLGIGTQACQLVIFTHSMLSALHSSSGISD